MCLAHRICLNKVCRKGTVMAFQDGGEELANIYSLLFVASKQKVYGNIKWGRKAGHTQCCIEQSFQCLQHPLLVINATKPHLLVVRPTCTEYQLPSTQSQTVVRGTCSTWKSKNMDIQTNFIYSPCFPGTVIVNALLLGEATGMMGYHDRRMQNTQGRWTNVNFCPEPFESLPSFLPWQVGGLLARDPFKCYAQSSSDDPARSPGSCLQ